MLEPQGREEREERQEQNAFLFYCKTCKIFFASFAPSR